MKFSEPDESRLFFACINCAQIREHSAEIATFPGASKFRLLSAIVEASDSRHDTLSSKYSINMENIVARFILSLFLKSVHQLLDSRIF